MVKWTKEKCHIEALKCNTRSEYQKKYPNSYDAACKRLKCLDEICSHMIKTNTLLRQKKKSYIKWTKEKCHIEALKYENRSDFWRFSQNAYDAANKYSWLDEICSHMKYGNKIKHTVESIHKISLKYETRGEFALKSPNEYCAAKRLKCLKIVCSHMNLLKNNWTKDECLEKALLCKSRKEFQINYNKYYSFAYRNNWLDEICSHMIIKINQYEYDRIIYCYKFSDNSIYIGLTKNIKLRNWNRKKCKNDAVNLYIEKTNLIPKLFILTEFIPAIEAQQKEQEFIDFYRKNGWNILNRYKAGSLGGSYQLLKL